MTIDLNAIYPENVGFRLSPVIYPKERIPQLQKQLGTQVVISLDGLAGVGKGTVGKAISEFLGLPHLHSGLIWRALTYIYHDLLLPLTDANTDIVISKIKAGVVDGAINIFYKDRPFADHELRNKLIDQHINEYNTNRYIRSKVDEALTNIVLSLHQSPFIIDLRGATPPYIAAAEQSGFTIIRIVLFAKVEEKVRRRFKEYIDTHKQINPHFELSQEQSQKLYEEAYNAIVTRDTQDVQSIADTNIGLIHPETGFIDTTNMSVDEVIGTTLQFIATRLSHRKS